MNERTSKVLACLVVIACVSAIGYVVADYLYWLYSPVVQVDVYSLTLTVSSLDDKTIMFSGVFKDSSGVGVGGATIYLYETDSVGTIITGLATATSEMDGSFSFTYTVPLDRTYYFKAGTCITS